MTKFPPTTRKYSSKRPEKSEKAFRRNNDKTFIKRLLTIQDQELFKNHDKRKLRQQYRKSRFSGDKTAPLTVSFPPRLSRHIRCFRDFPNCSHIN